MNIRAQVGTVFHLDKCIGCHTCSIACKNIWTDRQGTEYMWWNNVETKPGTGYPTSWEDQGKYKGGWEKRGKSIGLLATGKFRGYTNIFYQPYLPTIDDYYEPFTYKYEDLFDSPEADTQVTARPISLITGEHMDTIESGAAWDDDLGGSTEYAKKDLNLQKLTDEEQKSLFEFEKLFFFYLPRICNHCANPGCVASCPSGALYKRGEDGIVLVDQDKCRGWRYCVSACPYKKVYYNWKSGKAEKCILCYPRLETGQAQACFHSCVGRIRYTGVLLYDADRIQEIASSEDKDLVQDQRDYILDPFDPQIIAQAEKDGIHPSMVESAQKSPVYDYVKKWELALPLHPEFRTLPNLFYVPPLLPVIAKKENGTFNVNNEDYFGSIENARTPIKYLASLFSAGNEEPVRKSLTKLFAVRLHRRAQHVNDVDKAKLVEAIKKAGMSEKECEEIFKLTSLATYDDRLKIPPMHREYTAELVGEDDFMSKAYEYKSNTGFGYINKGKRGL